MLGGKVIVLILSVFDSASGTLLYEKVEQMPTFSIRNDRIEDCRVEGIRRAKKLVTRYRVTYPYAFANVNCKWVKKGPGQDV